MEVCRGRLLSPPQSLETEEARQEFVLEMLDDPDFKADLSYLNEGMSVIKNRITNEGVVSRIP